jgi:hypothetical protein
MKYFFLLPLTFVLISILACNDDDPLTYDYHAHFMQPSAADKHLGDVLFIDIEFESHSGEAIEHINIRIRDKANTVEVYNQPDDPHIGGVSDYEFHDQFVISAANGLTTGDWVLEAYVWGIDEGQEQIVETVEFTVLP